MLSESREAVSCEFLFMKYKLSIVETITIILNIKYAAIDYFNFLRPKSLIVAPKSAKSRKGIYNKPKKYPYNT